MCQGHNRVERTGRRRRTSRRDWSKSDKVRYVVQVSEQRLLSDLTGGSGNKKLPTAQEVQQALGGLPKVSSVTELPTDDSAHRFQFSAPGTTDIRPEIFALMVEKGWIMLELRRDAQTLEDVFKTLTKGDEVHDRGRRHVEADDDDSSTDATPDEDDGDEGDDDEDDEGRRRRGRRGKEGLTRMGTTMTIAKREFRSSFDSPLAYVADLHRVNHARVRVLLF